MDARQLQLPLVSEDDLRVFHDKHFSSLSSGSGSSNRNHDVTMKLVGDIEDHGGDDGLGYYPDGVKRTLTDDQIAMFRHSEIQALLRERRARRQTSEDEAVPDVSSRSLQPVGDIEPKTADEEIRSRSASAPESQTAGKRKWQRFIDVSGSNPEHLTHRRIARELDEQKASSIDLAYGDEESTDPISTKHAKLTRSASSGRKTVSYGNEDQPAPADSNKHAPQNLKFLWPTLGKKDNVIK